MSDISQTMVSVHHDSGVIPHTWNGSLLVFVLAAVLELGVFSNMVIADIIIIIIIIIIRWHSSAMQTFASFMDFS